MATTVATVVTDIKDRLRLGATDGEPTDAMLGRWVRAAAKWSIGQLQPPSELTVVVTSGPQAAITADLVYFVANGHQMLLESEWASQGQTLALQPAAADVGDTLTLWAFTDPGITDATTAFDTTCLFGTDWLEELITVMAAMQTQLRLANVSPSGDGSGHASLMRVLEEERNQLLAPYKQVKAEWLGLMQQRLAARAQFGDQALRQSAYAGFRNHSRKHSDLTGVGG